MTNDDSISCDPTATGILQCLRMLADEAAALHLTRTLNALREAIEACATERTETAFEADVMDAEDRVVH